MKHFRLEKVRYFRATQQAELTERQTAKLPELGVVLRAFVDSGGSEFDPSPSTTSIRGADSTDGAASLVICRITVPDRHNHQNTTSLLFVSIQVRSLHCMLASTQTYPIQCSPIDCAAAVRTKVIALHQFDALTPAKLDEVLVVVTARIAFTLRTILARWLRIPSSTAQTSML